MAKAKHKAPVFLGERMQWNEKLRLWEGDHVEVYRSDATWPQSMAFTAVPAGHMEQLTCGGYGPTPQKAANRLYEKCVEEFREIGAALGYEVE